MQQIIITSTDSIEGTIIEKYIDVISTNVVIGTNFFSDLGASLTDLFGGFSETYQTKLQQIYKIGIDKLKTKATYLGANAIVGLKIDFDEISGKGKSMFMISTLGTAVKVREIEKDNIIKIDESDTGIGLDILEQEYNKRIIVDKVINKELPTQKDWQFLLSTPIKEIAPIILEWYLEKLKEYENMLSERDKLLIANTSNFFRNLDENEAVEILYENITKNSTACIEIIKSNNLFSGQKVLDLINTGKFNTAIDCLSINKNFYTKEDLTAMEEIVTFFDNLKDLGKIEFVKGVLSKAKEKYICPNGHTNDLEVKYCATCGYNIKGLDESQVNKINNFKTKTSALKALLTKN
jgi:uncharacterized protein YbjQ (UPF0145 family)